ncbi:2-oxoglutarate carboxylase large subunit [Sedimentisphaera cyanobacteriorum]|uniref:2-oxoglutarate carboxylase large subunit n=1 Tax=Sedimentisphaera cyanobacteriorum TaxID=1940790 RepID=A0A1Q2HSF9_9BACT|nr:biotin/lipoyl-containing protein [Sedimentisphaera cyanobacteriorum]AQQ10389.1 2-oxoglutarate carboxylase large subunit [Sedimentisphaera cyanobacteriorum]
MAKKNIEVMITAFRDGFQSCYGARVLTEDFLPAVAAAKEAGITHFEAGGGARFQSLFFYCNESAFDMMDRFRETAGPDANLQTLARGVNVVGLESQSRDVINAHAKLFKKHGITTIRNFDALNDVNNLTYSGQCIHDAGLKHEVVVSMMELPPGCSGAHTPEFYEGVLKKILDAGIPFDSVCFKDASGTSTPAKVYDTMKLARKMLPEEISLRMHTHETAGNGVMCYRAALDGGADALDLSMSPVSGGTAQTDALVMWHALRGTDYELGFDAEKVREAERVFKDCMKDYFFPPEAGRVEPVIPWSPMPGGALTANTQMLRDNGLMDRYPEIIEAMSETVRKGGFGTSVTPVSQFYFQQAFNNVMFGPWEKIADGYGKMVLGYFGKTPCEPDPEVIKKASEQLNLEPTEELPVDINDRDSSKGLEQARKTCEAEGIEPTEENVFIVATCKDKGVTFLKGEAKLNIRKNEPKKDAGAEDKDGAKAYCVNLEGKQYNVTVKGSQAVVNGKTYNFDCSEGEVDQENFKRSSNATAQTDNVNAKLPGNVVKILVSEGDDVDEGQTLMILEAMKMETEVKSHVVGTVEEIAVSVGDSVKADQLLVKISM